MSGHDPEAQGLVLTIFAAPRSGSSMLSALLGHHPEINSYWELFRPDVVSEPLARAANLAVGGPRAYLWSLIGERSSNPGALLDELLRLQPAGRRVQAYKILNAQTGHDGELHLPHLTRYTIKRDIIASPRPSLYVVLERRNKLAAYVSQLLASRHHRWHGQSTADLSVVVNATSFAAFESETHRWYDWVRKTLVAQRRRILSIDYEELETHAPLVLQRVLAFMGVAPIAYDALLRIEPIDPRLNAAAYVKQAPRQLERQIANLRELPQHVIQRYLSSSGFAHGDKRTPRDETPRDERRLDWHGRPPRMAPGGNNFALRVRGARHLQRWRRTALNCGGPRAIEEACTTTREQHRWYEEVKDRARLRRGSHRQQWHAYLVDIYGEHLRGFSDSTAMVDTGLLEFFWASAPGRASFEATWACAHCGELERGTLWAPLQDAALNRHLLEAHEDAWLCGCGPQPHSAQSASSRSRVNDARVCQFADACLQTAASVAFHPERLSFPGFFVSRRRPGHVPWPQPQPQPPRTFIDDSSEPPPRDELQRGLPDHVWVEVLRIARNDVASLDGTTTCTVGQLWMWLAPGSGIWYNVGRTLDWRGSQRFQRLWALHKRPCLEAQRRGYDSIQFDAWDGQFTREIVDCRGASLPNANVSWHSACTPSHVKLLAGTPPRDRYAPALEKLTFSGESRACSCDDFFSFLNCVGESSTRPASRQGKRAWLEQPSRRPPHVPLSSAESTPHRFQRIQSQPPPSQNEGSAFLTALGAGGAFVVAFDSTRISLMEGERRRSTGGPKVAFKGRGLQDRLKESLCVRNGPFDADRFGSIRASFISERVPNTFCAQPVRDNRVCGTNDLLFLFEATESLWRSSCHRTLFDSCGTQPARCTPPNSTASDIATAQSESLSWFVNTLVGGRPPPLPACPSGPSICDATREASHRGHCEVRGREHLEQSMLSFQRSCVLQPSGRQGLGGSLEPVPEALTTCPPLDPSEKIPGTSIPRSFVPRGLLNNEIQFPCTREVLHFFADALIGLGVINVGERPSSTSAHPAAAATTSPGGGVGQNQEKVPAATAATRRLRAYHVTGSFARGLEGVRRPLELWEHILDASDGPPSGLHLTPERAWPEPSPDVPLPGSGVSTGFGGAPVPLAPSWGYHRAKDYGAPWQRIHTASPI